MKDMEKKTQGSDKENMFTSNKSLAQISMKGLKTTTENQNLKGD